MIGIVKKREIKKNRDGDIDRVLLQVEFTEYDVKTIELMPGHGIDVNPADGARVFVASDSHSNQLAISSTDDLTPGVDPGEIEIYSTDNPATTKLAKVKLNSDSEVVINDGTDYAVAFNDLKSEFNKLNDAYNDLITRLTTWVPVPNDGGAALKTAIVAPPSLSSTANIDNTKVDKVRLP